MAPLLGAAARFVDQPDHLRLVTSRGHTIDLPRSNQAWGRLAPVCRSARLHVRADTAFSRARCPTALLIYS